VQGPIRIAQEFARQQHEIGATGADNFVGLLGLGNEADGAGSDTGFVTDPLRKRNLIARTRDDALGRS
jgi:hypothetical protein